jgi:hypothetical protein
VTTRSALQGVLRLVTCCSVLTACVPRPGERGVVGDDRSTTGQRASVDAARELDQEGVRSYRAGRFTDAIVYFRAAYKLGGPSSELWNIVRCREGLDDAEGATAAIDDYLAAKDLAPQDRADAQREAQGLRSRLSRLTVTSVPSGALVSVDGKLVAGSTPLTIDLRAGMHSVGVRREGYASMTQPIEARFGRAVIVSLDLERPGK